MKLVNQPLTVTRVDSQEVAWFRGLDRPHMSNVIEQEALINLSVLLLSRIARLRKFYEYRRWQSKVVFETDKRYSTLVFCIGAFCSALAV
jgi:hypothetical protein